MKQFGLGILASTFLTVFVSSAMSLPVTVCDIARKPVPIGASATYAQRLESECRLATRYKQLREISSEDYAIALERINEFQALRFIDRYHYYVAGTKNEPVPLIFQLADPPALNDDGTPKPSDPSASPIAKSTIVWDNWSAGILQLNYLRDRVLRGKRLEVDDIKRTHRGFYTLSTERSSFNNDPTPGVPKYPSPNDKVWWKVAPEDVERTQTLLNDINSNYAKMELAGNPVMEYFDPVPRTVMTLKPLDGGGFGIYGGDSRANGDHITALLGFMNEMLAQGVRGEHMIWKGRAMTPGEVAFLAQQFFVQVHWFPDGNGRMSRLLQELVMTAFGLPPGASGDLMKDDAMTRNDEYYLEAIKKTEEQIAVVERCLAGAYSESPAGRESRTLGTVDQSGIEYSCRIIPTSAAVSVAKDL